MIYEVMVRVTWELKIILQYPISCKILKLIDGLGIKECTLIGHSIGGSVASLHGVEYPQNIEAIILINGSSVRIPDKDLEKHYVTRKVALTYGMGPLVEWIRHESIESEKAFQDEKNGNN